MTQKKKHHFISQTYLRGFCNDSGKVCVYSKDKPAQPWWVAPDAVAFENYYYSQPTPDGGQDNNRLEDFFSSIESDWPSLIARIKQREPTPGGLEKLLLFATMHRVRVPTVRDAAEKVLAESVRMTTRHLYDRGELPPLPSNLTFDYLDQHTIISIDPHKSIHAMADFAKGTNQIIHAIGFEILENETGEDFITSDNPVIYFDPLINSTLMQPYNIDPHRIDIEFMFPLTPRHLLWGHSQMKPIAGPHKAYYRMIGDKQFVKRANVLAARFAYRMAFSNAAHHQPLIKKYSATSPVMSVTHIKSSRGRGIFGQFIFGRREPKPKWNGREPEENVPSVA